MEFREMIVIVKRSKWIILAVAVVAAAIVGTSQFRSPTKYEADTLLVVGNIAPSSAQIGGRTGVEDQTASGYAELLVTQPVLENAINDGHLSLSASQLGSMLSTDTSTGSPYLKISATDTDRQRAQNAVNAVASALIKQVSDVQQGIVNDSIQRTEDQMTSVGKDLATANSQPVKDDARIGALDQFRQSLIQQYETLAQQLAIGPNLTVVSPAQESALVTQHRTTNTAIAFAIGILGGVVLGFVINSIRAALSPKKM